MIPRRQDLGRRGIEGSGVLLKTTELGCIKVSRVAVAMRSVASQPLRYRLGVGNGAQRLTGLGVNEFCNSWCF